MLKEKQTPLSFDPVMSTSSKDFGFLGLLIFGLFLPGSENSCRRQGKSCSSNWKCWSKRHGDYEGQTWTCSYKGTLPRGKRRNSRKSCSWLSERENVCKCDHSPLCWGLVFTLFQTFPYLVPSLRK
jgi:hypothetical protein